MYTSIQITNVIIWLMIILIIILGHMSFRFRRKNRIAKETFYSQEANFYNFGGFRRKSLTEASLDLGSEQCTFILRMPNIHLPLWGTPFVISCCCLGKCLSCRAGTSVSDTQNDQLYQFGCFLGCRPFSAKSGQSQENQDSWSFYSIFSRLDILSLTRNGPINISATVHQ